MSINIICFESEIHMQAKKLALRSAEHPAITRSKKELKELIQALYKNTVELARKLPDSTKKRKRTPSTIKVGTLLTSLRTPKTKCDDPTLGKFNDEMVSVFKELDLSLSKSLATPISEKEICRDVFKQEMLDLYSSISEKLEIIGSHYIDASEFEKAKNYYNSAGKFLDTVMEVEKKESTCEVNPFGLIYFDTAIKKLQINFNQAILDRENNEFKQAKKKLRSMIKLCADLSQTEAKEEFSIWAHQAADVYIQCLDMESSDYSLQAQIVRKWMSLELVPDCLKTSNLHKVKVLTDLAALFDRFYKTQKEHREPTTLPIIKTIKDYVNQSQIRLGARRQYKNVYDYCEKNDISFPCPSEVVNKLVKQLNREPILDPLPLTTKQALDQANLNFGLTGFKNNSILLNSIQNKCISGIIPSLQSSNELSMVYVKLITREISENQLQAVRYYPRSKASTVIFANKCKALHTFCEKENIEIKPNKQHSFLAHIDFSLLAYVAYESPDEIPAFYNLLLWWFDDKFIDELTADTNVSMIHSNIQKLERILYHNEDISLTKHDPENVNSLIKIAKKVKELLINKQITPENSPGFYSRTFETFNAQLDQAKRKQANEVLSPQDFYTQRLKFSGVWPSLELALSLLTTDKELSTKATVENSFINLLWEKVNWLVSIDNCWDSSIKEIFKEKDPENYVFIRYIEALLDQDLANKKENITDYFHSINFDLLQDVMKKVAKEANQVLFEIREMLGCFPEEFISKLEETAIQVGADWVKALDWSKRTVRYYGNLESNAHERQLLQTRE